MSSSKSLVLLTLLSITSALPTDPKAKALAPLHVDNLDIIELAHPGDDGRYTVSFGVADPHDGSHANCRAELALADAKMGLPMDLQADCDDNTYLFNVADFKHVNDFKLEVKHVINKHDLKLEADKLEAAKLEAEKLKAKQLEEEKLKAQRLEEEKLKVKEIEQKKLEAEKLKAKKLEEEKLKAQKDEAEKLRGKPDPKKPEEKAAQKEAERLEAEKLKAEKLRAEQLEAAKLEAEKLKAQELEAKKLEAEKLEAEKLKAQELEAKKHDEQLELLAHGLVVDGKNVHCVRDAAAVRCKQAAAFDLAVVDVKKH